jgi:5'-3' exoribonuclease 2
MNQQRARRFRAARDAEEDGLRKASIKAEWAGKIDFAEEKSENEFRFDSNVITPGTEFMHRLSIALKSYLVQRAQTDPLWKDLVLIFSDAFVPGEGEHKILDFIRSQRAQTGYDPNKRHCIYGADADLIMLGLSTHEAHFFVLREAFMQVNDKTCYKCKEKGHMSFECGTQQKAKAVVEFQFVKIAVVREYLQLEFKDIEHSVAKYDFERVVDDFVFLCFLVGNDFLPHLPSLQIREGALDAILLIYKNLLPKLGGFLTDQGKIIYANADLIFKDIATLEEEQFKQNYYRAQR